MDGLSESSAAGHHRVFAVIAAVALAVGAGYAATFARAPLQPSDAFVPVIGSLGAGAAALTAYLLGTQARVVRSLPLALLAIAYLFTSLCSVTYVMSFGHVFGDPAWFAQHAQLGIWFWLASHAGFPLIVIASTFATVRYAGRPFLMGSRHIALGIVGVFAAVAGIAWFVVSFERVLPVLMKDDQYGALIATGVGPAVLVLIGIALVSLILGTRLRSVTQLWLGVALWASFLDTALMLDAGARFTLGWYVSRVENVAASTIVLVAMLATIAVMFEEYAKRSRIDALTGLANRRSFEDSLAIAMAVGMRTDRPTSLVVLDVDHFKSYNDRYGHVVGDAALRSIAAAMRNSLKRRSDVVARYGGDAFAAILPTTPAPDASRLAEEIRLTVERLAIVHADVPGGIVTVSVGVATLATGRSRITVEGNRFVSVVDHALALAKERGRNGVASATFAPEPDEQEAAGAYGGERRNRVERRSA